MPRRIEAQNSISEFGRLMKNSIIFASVIFILAGASSCKKAKPVLVASPAKESPLEITVSASGKVEPEKLVEIRSKAGGEIIELPYRVGDQAEKGDLIVRIDPRQEQSRLKEAQSKIVSSRAELARAEVINKQSAREYGRLKELLNEGAVDRAQVEESEDRLRISQADLEIARANLSAAQAALKDAQLRLEDTTIRAPITGVILSRSVEAGQVISSAISGLNQGTLLMTMADLAKIQVKAKVDETDIPRVKKGQEARIEFDAFPEVEFKGVVASIWPQAAGNENISSFPVEIEITDARKSWLKPGMQASVDIIIKKIDKTLVVPVEAVLEREGKFGVYLIQNGKPVWRVIEVGDSGMEMVEVKKGLKPGDQVVTRGFEQIEK